MSELIFTGLADYFNGTNVVSINFKSSSKAITSYQFQFCPANATIPDNQAWKPITILKDVSFQPNTNINVLLTNTFTDTPEYTVFILSTSTQTVIWQKSTTANCTYTNTNVSTITSYTGDNYTTRNTTGGFITTTTTGNTKTNNSIFYTSSALSVEISSSLYSGSASLFIMSSSSVTLNSNLLSNNGSINLLGTGPPTTDANSFGIFINYPINNTNVGPITFTGTGGTYTGTNYSSGIIINVDNITNTNKGNISFYGDAKGAINYGIYIYNKTNINITNTGTGPISFNGNLIDYHGYDIFIDTDLTVTETTTGPISFSGTGGYDAGNRGIVDVLNSSVSGILTGSITNLGKGIVSFTGTTPADKTSDKNTDKKDYGINILRDITNNSTGTLLFNGKGGTETVYYNTSGEATNFIWSRGIILGNLSVFQYTPINILNNTSGSIIFNGIGSDVGIIMTSNITNNTKGIVSFNGMGGYDTGLTNYVYSGGGGIYIYYVYINNSTNGTISFTGSGGSADKSKNGWGLMIFDNTMFNTPYPSNFTVNTGKVTINITITESRVTGGIYNSNSNNTGIGNIASEHAINIGLIDNKSNISSITYTGVIFGIDSDDIGTIAGIKMNKYIWNLAEKPKKLAWDLVINSDMASIDNLSNRYVQSKDKNYQLQPLEEFSLHVSTQNLDMSSSIPAPINGTWSSICYGDGMYVAISQYGDNMNQIMKSTDMKNWTVSKATGNLVWKSICYGDGLFVAVSQSGNNSSNETNQVMISNNGINWTSYPATGNLMWESVCYKDGLYVAVAASGDNMTPSTNQVMTSMDGMLWESHPATGTLLWFSVCAGKDMFLALSIVGDNMTPETNQVMISKDGKNWESYPALGENILWASVCYGNGMYVAVSFIENEYTIMSSNDGKMWTPQKAPGNLMWRSIAYGDGIFVAVAEDGDNMSASTNQIMYSNDGIKWHSIAATGNMEWQTICYGVNNFIVLSDNGDNMTPSSNQIMMIPRNTFNNIISYPAPYNLGWHSICYGNGIFVALSIWGVGPNNYLQHQIMISSDGKKWITTESTNKTYKAWYGVCYGKGMFVAVGENEVMISKDGKMWESRTTITGDWRSICYGDGLFIALSPLQVMVSNDGIIWNGYNTTGSLNWNSICYGNGTFVAVAANGNNFLNKTKPVMISNDGKNWKSYPAVLNMKTVCYGNNMFVAIASSFETNSSMVVTSEDGKKWTSHKSIPDMKWTCVTYGDGIFIAVNSNSNTVIASMDGIKWTEQQIPGNLEWQSICYGNGIFAGVALTGINNSPESNQIITIHRSIFDKMSLNKKNVMEEFKSYKHKNYHSYNNKCINIFVLLLIMFIIVLLWDKYNKK